MVGRMRIRPSQGASYLEDKISQLPDEILISILSRLAIKEAATTSILSRRWEKLWTFVFGSLNFDASKTFDDIACQIKTWESEKRRYISWVNQVLKSHQSQTIEEFRVHFYLDKSCSSYMDNWINFAMKRRVQRLELILSNKLKKCEHYTFPCGALEFSSFNSLTDLRLSYVDVNGEVLEHFLCNCRSLERLFVKHSRCLVNLKVSGLSLKLKNLEILFCYSIESIDISAVNLESFYYFGPIISMPFKNFPQLIEASFGGYFCDSVIENFHQLSTHLTCLKTLILDIAFVEKSLEIFNLPVLSNLKHLELIISADDYQNLRRVSSFLKASPFLHRFVLRSYAFGTYSGNVLWKTKNKCEHEFLKVVEVVGFVGSPNDVELVTYLLEIAVSLERISFDPRCPLLVGRSCAYDNMEKIQAARECARQLEPKLPPGAHLIVL